MGGVRCGQGQESPSTWPYTLFPIPVVLVAEHPMPNLGTDCVSWGFPGTGHVYLDNLN